MLLNLSDWSITCWIYELDDVLCLDVPLNLSAVLCLDVPFLGFRTGLLRRLDTFSNFMPKREEREIGPVRL